jgi:hypothetical protein
MRASVGSRSRLGNRRTHARLSARARDSLLTGVSVDTRVRSESLPASFCTYILTTGPARHAYALVQVNTDQGLCGHSREDSAYLRPGPNSHRLYEPFLPGRRTNEKDYSKRAVQGVCSPRMRAYGSYSRPRPDAPSDRILRSSQIPRSLLPPLELADSSIRTRSNEGSLSTTPSSISSMSSLSSLLSSFRSQDERESNALRTTTIPLPKSYAISVRQNHARLPLRTTHPDPLVLTTRFPTSNNSPQRSTASESTRPQPWRRTALRLPSALPDVDVVCSCDHDRHRELPAAVQRRSERRGCTAEVATRVERNEPRVRVELRVDHQHGHTKAVARHRLPEDEDDNRSSSARITSGPRFG